MWNEHLHEYVCELMRATQRTAKELAALRADDRPTYDAFVAYVVQHKISPECKEWLMHFKQLTLLWNDAQLQMMDEVDQYTGEADCPCHEPNAAQAAPSASG